MLEIAGSLKKQQGLIYLLLQRFGTFENAFLAVNH